MDSKADEDRKRSNGYGMVIDKDAIRHERDNDTDPNRHDQQRKQSRSRSPRSYDRHREAVSSEKGDRSRDYRRDRYEDRSRKRR